MLFAPTIAGSLPKPGWLAETEKLRPAWRLETPYPIGRMPPARGGGSGSALAREQARGAA